MRTATAFGLLGFSVFVLGCAPEKPPDERTQRPDHVESRPTDGQKAEQAPAQTITIDGVPIGEPKWDFAYLENAWGIKLKSLKPVEREDGTGRLGSNPRLRYKALLEFTRDLNAAELMSLNTAMLSGRTTDMALYFLDKDNVVLTSCQTNQSQQGTITGTKGDAFWLMMDVRYYIPPNTKRGEYRRDREKALGFKDKKDR